MTEKNSMNQTLIEPTPTVLAPAQAANKGWRDAAWRALVLVNFLALIGAALVLRGWQLDNTPGLNGDEAWLGVQAAHLAAGEPIVWRTPTGNPVNLFLLLPTAALHWIFTPSVLVLRAVALASGVAAIGANFWLCRRIFDRRSALVSTAVLAVLPIAIAYSRFAWDASQTLLATVLVLYFGLATVEREVPPPGGRSGKNSKWMPTNQIAPDWLPALLAFGAAIWIHPTNVFAVWLLIVPAVYRYGDGWRATAQAAWQGASDPKQGANSGKLPRWLATAAVGLVAVAGAWFCRGLLGTAVRRLIDPEQGGLFLRELVRLFSGGTIFEFIPGPPRTSTGLDAADMAIVSLAAVAALGLVQRLRRADSGRERCLVWSVVLMVGSFYLVAGPAALAPHFERYGMCLVAPIGVLLALGWSHWLGSRGLGTRGSKQAWSVPQTDGFRRRGQARVAGVMFAALAWLWLAHFYRDYFVAFQSTGGTSHVAFRTGAIEPKLAALETILAAEQQADSSASGSSRPIWIVADSWWSYWPLTYFAANRPNIHVVPQDEWAAAKSQVAPTDAVWGVKFVATDEPWLPTASTVANDQPAGKTTIRDYAGAPLIVVERLQAPERSADRRMTQAE